MFCMHQSSETEESTDHSAHEDDLQLQIGENSVNYSGMFNPIKCSS